MKICIYGAGAIGGLIGTRLAATGQHDLSAVARGATLAALQTQGFRVQSAAGLISGPVQAEQDPARLGPQDVVVIAVKGGALPNIAMSIAPLLGPDTVVLPALNGVPWWFGESLPALQGLELPAVNPGGTLSEAIALKHVVGCVVHASASCPEPGLVHHRMGQGLIIGEPLGGVSERLQALAAALRGAGFEVTESPRIQQDVWYKLWGNMTMNPISALTGATCDQVLADPLLREFCSAAMREAAVIGERLGCPIAQSPEDRHAVTQKLGAFKTSMLQDVEAGRSIELDAIVTSVQQIGQVLAVPTPFINALLGMTRVFARQRGLY
ncbi:MAG: 2-dehydropantoate 2-reductase [Ideonella sp. MAG2]|nr:MAG: 2-dehydropantoate 2-reductase [Ideonella sp. MAG2]